MKSLSAALTSHLQQDVTTLATALKLTRADNVVMGFTSHDVSDAIGGVTYSASPGLDVASIVTTSGLAVGNLEITTLHDGTVFSNVDIMGGAWSNAAFLLFRYDWASLADGVDYLLAGNVGEIRILKNKLKVELRDLRQYLQQPLGSVSSKACRYRLGSIGKSAGGLCLKDVTAAPFTVAGTLTSVTTRQAFADSSKGQASDYFGDGLLTWTGGASVGLSAKIKTFAGGAFVLYLPMAAPVAVGDTFTATAGCRKRLAEDCVTKFANGLNFGGEPHRPGFDSLMAPVTLTV
jgi:uncharacterized phage protein (TIGR02218 family)